MLLGGPSLDGQSPLIGPTVSFTAKPSQQQKQAAASQQALEKQEASTAAHASAIVKDAYDTIKPFAPHG